MAATAKIPLFERKATGLVREIGPFGLLTITMSYAIGGGINLLSVKNGYLYPGSHVGLGFLLAGIPVILVAVAYALLAIAMPRAGGPYVFISRIVSPTWGFLASWMSWFAGWMLVGIIAYYDVFFWGTMLFCVGKAFGRAGIVNAALWMMKPVNSLWVGIIFIIIAFIICSLRLGILVRIIQALWIIPVIGSIMIVGTYGVNWGIASARPEVFKARWDAVMGAGSYDEVMSVALKHGFDPKKWTTFSWSETWRVASYAAIWAYGSPATPPTAVAGEVTIPTKTQIFGTVLGTALIATYYVVVSTVMFGACDPFIRAYTFNYYEGYTDLYKITPVITPNLPFFAGILTGNLGLAAFYAASAAIWLWNDIPPFFLYLTRFVFAWAFDRCFPSIFAKIHPTWRSPIYANILVTILAIIACAMCWGWWIYGIFTLLDNVACFGWIFPDMFVALAAAVFPIVRPELYKASPVSKYEIAGIPLITIFGIASFFGMSLFVYLVVATFAFGPAGPSPDLWLTVAMFTIGLIISLYYQFKARKMGIPVHEIFREVPPA